MKHHESVRETDDNQPERRFVASAPVSPHVGASQKLVSTAQVDSPRASRLRGRLRRMYPLRDLELILGEPERTYRVMLPADPDAPLDEFAARLAHLAPSPRAHPAVEISRGHVRNTGIAALRAAANQARRSLADGEHMPYWALLWASGLALAEELLRSPFTPPHVNGTRGPSALELGCGLGLTATAALDVGLAVWAADYFPEALAFCRYNALRNTGHVPRTAVLDWRTEVGRAACLALGRFDLLLAADVLYEEQDIAPLLELAPRVLAPGGTFWLAEPGRRVARAFVEAACNRGWHDEERIYERVWPPDGDRARVVVHRLTGLTAGR